MLCADAESAFCSHPAESLCRACSRPLCDRHNDPRRLYWHAALDWSVLCPDWKTADRTEWARVNAALPRFPAPGVEPDFEWRHFERESRQAVAASTASLPIFRCLTGITPGGVGSVCHEGSQALL